MAIEEANVHCQCADCRGQSPGVPVREDREERRVAVSLTERQYGVYEAIQ